MRTHSKTRALAVVLLLTFCGPAHAASKEVALKSAFLLRFASFVEWPERAFEGGDSAFVFAVVGDDSIEDSLRSIAGGRVVKGRPVRVVRMRTSELPEPCHVLFVGRGASLPPSKLVSKAAERPILTVSDADSFAKSGGVIQFIKRGGRVRFEINRGVARRVALEISAKLLSLATEIYDD